MTEFKSPNYLLISVPEKFLYDPAFKSTVIRNGGQNAIEFIAPSEYMLRPLQVNYSKKGTITAKLAYGKMTKNIPA